MNVQFSIGFKKYQNEIPSYLWNRPRIIVEDILNKMKQVSPAIIESVQPIPTVPETTFLVRGDSTHDTEMKAYLIDFGTKKNSCVAHVLGLEETALFVSTFLQLSIVVIENLKI